MPIEKKAEIPFVWKKDIEKLQNNVCQIEVLVKIYYSIHVCRVVEKWCRNFNVLG